MELSDCCGNCKTKNKQKKKTEKTGIKVSMKICKALVKSHLHYGGVIQDKANNETLHWKLESIQCNAWARNPSNDDVGTGDLFFILQNLQRQ